MNSVQILILVAVLLALLVIVLIILFGRQSAELRAPRPTDASLQLLHQQVDSLRGQLHDTLGRLASDVNQQIGGLKESVTARLAENVQMVQASGQQVGNGLGQALQAVSDVRQQLGQLREASERIREVGQDVSGLKQLLQAPQFRGGLGEFLLEEVLAQLFPRELYSISYAFESGERVDAALHIGRGLIPIDSKFPLMYIPAENVYYESIIREENGSEETSLFEYALARRVIPVSPNTLFAYLQVIALGLKGMKVEGHAQNILAGLSQLQMDLGKLQGSFDKVGTQFQYALSNFAEAQKRLTEFTQHLSVLTALPADSPTALGGASAIKPRNRRRQRHLPKNFGDASLHPRWFLTKIS